MDPLADLVGQAPGIAHARERIRQILGAISHSSRLPPILLQGETGTGKNLVAGVIHRAGPRRGGPFVDVNCAAIPEGLLEAELFGFERGAFTDARQAKAGLFQTADGGTIFLDEVAQFSDALQAKLLKVIEERTVRRLGRTRSEPVEVSIIAATNDDLVAAVGASVPPGPLSSARCPDAAPAPASRASRRRPAAGRALPCARLHGLRPAAQDADSGRPGGALCAPLGPATCAS